MADNLAVQKAELSAGRWAEMLDYRSVETKAGLMVERTVGPLDLHWAVMKVDLTVADLVVQLVVRRWLQRRSA